MARFNGPSRAASAHTAMMRRRKAGKGGCLGVLVALFSASTTLVIGAAHMLG